MEKFKIQNGYKVCSLCLANKAVEEFAKRKHNKSGIHSWCLSCFRDVNKANYSKDEVRKRARERRLVALYGMSLGEFNELLLKQGNKCAICGTLEPMFELPVNGKKNSNSGWHVDHDHVSKKVRGILCPTCNCMLGYAKDNPQTLARGIRYLLSQ